ncbi:MAG TPA: protein translocase subunit SecF, partial [Micrococcus luteus]|nr:protein translocase subunit SecF [Micrococcus luteus]
MNRFADWGNALYSGRISYPFIQRWRRWFALAALLLVLAGGLTALRGGFNLGIEFRGGSEFTVSQTASTDVAAGERAVTDVLADGHATVTNVAPGTVRVQTEQLDDAQTRAVAANLQEAYGV